MKKLSGRKVCDATSTTRESIACVYRTASPLTRSLRWHGLDRSLQEPSEVMGPRLRGDDVLIGAAQFPGKTGG